MHLVHDSSMPWWAYLLIGIIVVVVLIASTVTSVYAFKFIKRRCATSEQLRLIDYADIESVSFEADYTNSTSMVSVSLDHYFIIHDCHDVC